jgi:hypothetical protein
MCEGTNQINYQMEVKMSRTGSFALRLIGALLLIGLMIAGGFMAYRAGIAQGVARAPEVAKAISQAAENGQALPVPPMYGYGYGPGFYPMYFHPFGFFPFGICGSILFVFIFFGLLRLLFFRPWAWGRHGYWRGYHGHPWGGPPWMRPEDEEGEKKEEKPEEKK